MKSEQLDRRGWFRRIALTGAGTTLGARAADFPQAELSNGPLRVKVYLPDAARGFYRATRFDWSGMIASVLYSGHELYGHWFQRTDPKVHDFIYDGADIVAGPCTSATGPAEEFVDALGYDTAKPGGTFLKIGVGMLRKPDDARYDHFKLYEIANPGTWIAKTSPDSIEFEQKLDDLASKYGYLYRKTLRLTPGKPEMVLEHSLRNTGARPLETRVYNHNFLAFDHHAPGPGIRISVPFTIQSDQPPDKALAEIRGHDILYLKTLEGQERVTTQMLGFGSSASDYDIRVEDSNSGVGVRAVGDRPLANMALWSIRAVLAVEPFVQLSIQPGQSFTWRIAYTYYAVTH
jgi:hypothetical protein